MDRNPVYTSNTSKFIAEENGKSFFYEIRVGTTSRHARDVKSETYC